MSGADALPDFDFEPTREFWAAAQREELAIPRCDSCRTFVWYPAPQCGRCASTKLTWTRVSGEATLFSWSVVTRGLFKAFAAKAPYTTGLVALREDPAVRLVTLLVDCEPDALRVEMPVRAVFRKLEFPGVERSVLAPMFAPAEIS